VSFSYEELAEIRYYIPQHPELSGQEYQTTAFLKERLEELGIHVLESGLKTGLIAEIGSGQPVVALRADIDALPILEQTNLPYQSQNPGVMHACGHDFHQTSLLGAAALLKEKEAFFTANKEQGFYKYYEEEIYYAIYGKQWKKKIKD